MFHSSGAKTLKAASPFLWVAHGTSSLLKSTKSNFLKVTCFFFPLPCPPQHFFLSEYLVVLEVPAFDLLVFPTGEEVWASGTDGHSANGADVAREGELELPAGQVPNLPKQKHNLNKNLPQRPPVHKYLHLFSPYP